MRKLALRPGANMVPRGGPLNERFVEAVILHARDHDGLVLDAKQVQQAAPYLRQGDSEHEAALVARVLPLLLVPVILWVARASLAATLEEAAEEYLEERPWSWGSYGRKLTINLLTGGLLWGAKAAFVYKTGPLTLKTSVLAAAEDSYRTTLNLHTLVASELISSALFGPTLAASVTCKSLLDLDGFRTTHADDLENSLEACAQANIEHHQEELIDLDASVQVLPDVSDPLIPLGISVTDGTFAGFIFPGTLANLQVSYSVVPTATGSHEVDLMVLHEGVEYPLTTDVSNVLVGEVNEVESAQHSISTAQLLGLSPSDNREFAFFLRLRKGSYSEKFLGIHGAGYRVAIDGPANTPPIGMVNVEKSGRTVSFEGSYWDVEGDAPSLLTLQIDGPGGQQLHNLLPHLESGSGPVQRAFALPPFILANGVYTYGLHYSDGVDQRENGPFSMRVSQLPPQVSIQLSSPNASLGQLVPGTVLVTDSIGPVPGVEVGLQTDLRSPFFAGADMVRHVVTNGTGQASFSYRPDISGTHTVLAMEPNENEYDYTFLSVGGNPSDWTAEWTFSQQSNSPTQATYQVEVHILHQGQPISNGDDVYFSANHGSFEKGVDEVGSSSTANDDYTLTAAETALGPEQFTISIPEYDVELTHSTELPVGTGGPLEPVRTLNLSADTSENYSFGVNVSQDGRYIALVQGKTVKVLQLSDLAQVRSVTPTNEDLNCVDFSPDGEKVVVGDKFGNLAIVTIANGNTITASRTDGHADIVNVDWYAADRIAAATAAGNVVDPWQGGVRILNDSLTLIQPIALTSTTSGDIRRISCNPTNQKCVASSEYGDHRWFFMSTAGTVHNSFVHPDESMYLAMPFNPAGTRLLVGGEDANGAVQVDLYSVSGSTLGPLSDPVTANSKTFASTFLSFLGAERIAIGGNSMLEIFPIDGGGALRSTTDPHGAADSSYHLEYIPGLELLAAITNSSQTFYNVSADQTGPSISIFQPPPLPYSTTEVEITGNVTDSSGVADAQWKVGNGTTQPLVLAAGGSFEIQVTSIPVGTTEVTIDAVDTKNSESSASIVITRLDDDEGPIVSQVVVSPESAEPGANLALTCRVEDASAGVGTVSAVVRAPDDSVVGTPILSPTGGSNYSALIVTAGLPFATYSIDVTAADTSPNANSSVNENAALFILANQPPEDIDGDGQSEALTDGLLALRWLFGFRGDPLIEDAVDIGSCTRCIAEEVEAYLASVEALFDIDGNGEREALTDGLVNLRWLFGFSGAALVNNAIDFDHCTQCTAQQVEDFLTAREDD